MDFNIKKINRLKTLITIFLVFLAGLCLYVFEDVFEGMEEKLVNLRSSLSTDGGLYSGKFAHHDDRIVIISINDLTQYEAAKSRELNLSRWPWSRKIWAQVVEYLERQNPELIVLDLNFSNYEDITLNYSSADVVLAGTLSKYDNVILSTGLRTSYEDTNTINSAKILDNFDNPFLPAANQLDIEITNPEIDNNISFYSHTPIPDIYTKNTYMAVTNLPVEKREDMVSRSQPVYKLLKGNRTYYLPSIPLAVLLKHSGAKEVRFLNDSILAGNYKIPLDKNGQVLINWHGRVPVYTDIPITSILLSMVRGVDYFEYDNRQVPLEFFKDKIIIIAQTQLNTETHDTPVAQEFPDAEIKANIIDNYINDADITNTHKRQFAKKLPLYKAVLITVAFCSAILFVILIATNMLLAFMNGFLIILIYCWLSFLIFCHPRFHLLLDMSAPLYCMAVTLFLTFLLKAHHEYKKRKKIERIFGNLVSENVLKQLINKPHKLNLKAGLQKVTVMSCNIYNNIEINDVLSPEHYIEMINKSFETIENIIFKYNGTINRFVGNSVLVYWGYPIHSRKDTENAIKAALEIEAEIDKFNKEYFTDGSGVLVRIAINHGAALIGQVGSKNVSDFTLLGDTVDIIEKIENVCVEFDKKIIVTEQTVANLDKQPELLFAGKIRLKNSDKKITLYEVKSL